MADPFDVCPCPGCPPPSAGVVSSVGEDGFFRVLESHDPVDSARRIMGFAQVGD